MNQDMLLLVMIVSEVALRSSLAARLSMGGADLVTAKNFDDPQLTRNAERPTILITDAGAAMSREGGASALSADRRWRRVVVLTPDATPVSDDPRLFYLERATAAAGLAALVGQWQAEA
ncbi:hypothetical protein [Sphingomonas hengshuiensis]|uniref:hypothetical protein n=1 Tax=Sphingomonas hengshuiensis TaxID=1609977 RepID=UPI000697B6BC|nr:hypothetical protein [Sphingomonas hengshuiensis]